MLRLARSFYAISIMLVLISIFYSRYSFAQETEIDFDELQISLVTIGPGNLLPTFAGHTVLRIQSEQVPLDVSVNFGVFDIAQQGFLTNYLSNHMRYNVNEIGSSRLLDFYKAERRSVWVDPLNLTAKQKQAVFQRVQWWLRPENRSYRYDFVVNNCATIVRDILDEALHSKISEFYAEPSDRTVRQLTNEHFKLFPWVYVAVNAFFSSPVDQKITQYHEMFLPLSLRSHLLKMPAVDDQGHFVSGTFLAEKRSPVYAAGEREVPASAAAILVVLWGALLAGFVVLLIKKERKWPRRLFALTAVCWGGLAFTLSMILWLAWLVTDHVMAHQNIHLLVLWPTDLLLVWAGVKSWRPAKVRTSKWMLCYLGAHMLGLITAGLLWGVGYHAQDITPVAAALYAPLVLLAAMNGLLFLQCKRSSKSGEDILTEGSGGSDHGWSHHTQEDAAS